MSYVEEETIKMVEQLRGIFIANCYYENQLEVPEIINELKKHYGDESIEFQTLTRCCYVLDPRMIICPNELPVLEAFVYYVQAYCSYLAERDGYVEEWVLKEMPRTPCPTLDKLNAALDNVIAADRIKNGT